MLETKFRRKKTGEMTAVEFKNVSFSYQNGKQILKNLNFSIEEGQEVAFIGRNGSGKSTTAKLINCLLSALSGEILVYGMVASDKKNVFEIRKTAGMVFQNPDNQSVATIVEDDVAFGPENLGVEREEIAKRIDFALKVTEMEEFRNKTFSRLSGGQKQRIAIASVLAIKPKILILDEATSMLDPKGRNEIMDIVEKLRKEENLTVILITHYMEETINCDKVFVFNDGEIIKSGTPREVFADEEAIKKAGLTLPRATIIAKKLKEKGIDAGEVLTEEELEGNLCRLFAKT